MGHGETFTVQDCEKQLVPRSIGVPLRKLRMSTWVGLKFYDLWQHKFWGSQNLDCFDEYSKHYAFLEWIIFEPQLMIQSTSTVIQVICAMVKSRYIGDGHPTFSRNHYNGYINPYYWVDDQPLLYGNNGSLDPGTYMFETLVWKLYEISCQKPFLQEKRKESIDHYPIASMGLLWQRNNAIQCKANIRSSAPIVWVWLWEYKRTFKPPGGFLVEMNQNHKLVIAVHGWIYPTGGFEGWIHPVRLRQSVSFSSSAKHKAQNKRNVWSLSNSWRYYTKPSSKVEWLLHKKKRQPLPWLATRGDAPNQTFCTDLGIKKSSCPAG